MTRTRFETAEIFIVYYKKVLKIIIFLLIKNNLNILPVFNITGAQSSQDPHQRILLGHQDLAAPELGGVAPLPREVWADTHRVDLEGHLHSDPPVGPFAARVLGAQGAS